MRIATRVAVMNGVLVILGAVALGVLPQSLRPGAVPSLAPAAVLLAVVAAWRSWVHAREWIAHPSAAWRGVVEAAAIGPGITVTVCLFVLMTRPDAVASVLSLALRFCVATGAVGLVAGLILRSAALALLTRAVRLTKSNRP